MSRKKETPFPWVSWSQVDMWHKCPAMYEERYIKRRKPLRTYDMRLGSAAHKAAQAIGQATLKDIELDTRDVRTICRAAVTQEMLAGEIGPGDWGQLVEGMIQWSRECYFRKDELHGAEVECSVPYSGDPNVRLLFKIDAVFLLPDGSMDIIDLKNSRTITRKTDIMDSRQGPIYCLGMLEKVPGLKTLRFGHWYVRHKSYNMVDVDVDQVRHVRDWIDQALEGITSGKFPARVNNECDRCQRRGSCPEYRSRYKGIRGGPIKSAQDAHERIGKLSAMIKLLEAERETYREHLGQLADEADQVLVDEGSMAWYHRVGERRIFPAQEVADYWRKHGENILDRLTLKTTELDKLNDALTRSIQNPGKRAKIEEGLAKLARIEKQTKLVLGKPLPAATKQKAKNKRRRGRR